MINQSDEPTLIKRKSDFDLTAFATLKVPKTQYLELKQIADGMQLHWSEVARRILRAWIKGENKETVKRGVFHPEPVRLTDVDTRSE